MFLLCGLAPLPAPKFEMPKVEMPQLPHVYPYKPGVVIVPDPCPWLRKDYVPEFDPTATCPALKQLFPPKPPKQYYLELPWPPTTK